MEENRKLYLQLRKIFTEKGLQIGDVAERGGMPQSTLSNILGRLKRGENIKTQNLFKILKAADIKMELIAV